MGTLVMIQKHKAVKLQIKSIGETETDSHIIDEVCPDCDGTGIVTGTDIMPECCGRFDKYGGCCNSPVPLHYPVPEQCHSCMASGRRTTISKLT